MTVSTLKPRLDHEHVRELLKGMIRIRRFEDKCAELYSKQKIRGFLHLYDGEEAIATGIIPLLAEKDRVVATYREHGQALARGIPMGSVLAEMYGKAEGCAGGRGGSMHLFSREHNFYGGNAIVGGGLPMAVGLGLADRLTKNDAVTACFFGEGAVAEGEFHESLNLAVLWDIPVLFVCENNGYAMGTALELSESQIDISAKAGCYGIESESVDGMDVVAVEAAARRALKYIADTGKPYFIECRTYRFRAHSLFDAQLYRSKDEVAEWRKKGPILRFQTWLEESGLLHSDEVSKVIVEIDEEIAEAVTFAEAGTDEPVENLSRFVLSPDRPEAPVPIASSKSVKTTYREAVRAGIVDALSRDPRVFLMGEDVGPLWRMLRRQQRPVGSIRPGSYPRHPLVRVRFYRCRYWCCNCRYAPDCRGHDREFLAFGTGPDSEYGGHSAAHVQQSVRRTSGDPNGNGSRQTACSPALAFPGGLVCPHSWPACAGAGHHGRCARHAVDGAGRSRSGADF